jgi:hypothetical protein
MDKFKIKYFLELFMSTIIVIMIVVGCTKYKAPTIIEKESSQYNFNHFLNGITKFPYEASKDKQRKIINGYSKLSLELNKQTIKDIMGEPDAEFIGYKIIKGTPDKFIFSSWGYYLHRHDKFLANEAYDKAIFLNFDINEKLYWAYRSEPNNNKLYQQIGSPLPASLKKLLK